MTSAKPNSTDRPLTGYGRLCKRGHAVEGHNAKLRGSDGMYLCRKCINMSHVKSYEKHKEARRAYHRAIYPKRRLKPNYRAVQKKMHDAYYARHTEKIQARGKLNKALLYGRITRPEICSRCDEITNIEGHHIDYNRFYDVLWLCRLCHEWLHHTTVGEYLTQGGQLGLAALNKELRG